MSLSAYEHRTLELIEQQAAADDPRLAARLANFGGAGRRVIARPSRGPAAGRRGRMGCGRFGATSASIALLAAVGLLVSGLGTNRIRITAAGIACLVVLLAVAGVGLAQAARTRSRSSR